MLGDADSYLSQETASEVVTFADGILIVTVAGEDGIADERIHETDDGSANGPVARHVSLDIESVIWEGKGERELPRDRTTLESWGWYVQADRTRPFRAHGEERLEVGERYVLPIGWDGKEWTPLLGASFHLIDGKVVPLDDQASDLAVQIKDLPETELPDFFAAASPLPGSEEFLSLPMRERAEAYYSRANS